MGACSAAENPACVRCFWAGDWSPEGWSSQTHVFRFIYSNNNLMMLTQSRGPSSDGGTDGGEEKPWRSSACTEVGFSLDAQVWVVDRVTAAPDSMLAEPAWTSAAAALLDGGSQASLWARAPMRESDHSRAGTAQPSRAADWRCSGPVHHGGSCQTSSRPYFGLCPALTPCLWGQKLHLLPNNICGAPMKRTWW